MPPNKVIWHRLAAASGLSAVALGAYGAHKFRPADKQFVEVWQRGNEYHLIHSLLLAMAPNFRRSSLVGGLAASGIVLFCGGCYAAALMEDRRYSISAPFGGFALMGAWIALPL
ncbi:hypothetical protein WJX74_010137 [Apatococcus lobatus]|uniref:Transmembrane protein 256 homolog n=1 Tax=Apatococcus lobatus TaxID=904363 RepID=A0AAW1SFM2_9CHLO